MDHLLYVAASGANEIMLAQAANTHNLANASTPGFRSDLLMAQSKYLVGAGHETRTYVHHEEKNFDSRMGAINATERSLDVAINGDGWIAVQAPDGSEAYTRRGDLRVNEFGQLMNGAGQQLIGNSGPIALPPFSEILVGGDGTVSLIALGEAPNTLVEVDRIKLVNPDSVSMTKNRSGMIQTSDNLPAAADASVSLISGSLETSNVNATEAMVEMIALARQYETQIKLMKKAEQLDSSAAALMRLS